MSLVQGYSSGEDDDIDISKDVFGISSIPSAKKIRIDEPPKTSLVAQAAPHVLSEVPWFLLSKSCSTILIFLDRTLYTRRRLSHDQQTRK